MRRWTDPMKARSDRRWRAGNRTANDDAQARRAAAGAAVDRTGGRDDRDRVSRERHGPGVSPLDLERDDGWAGVAAVAAVDRSSRVTSNESDRPGGGGPQLDWTRSYGADGAPRRRECDERRGAASGERSKRADDARAAVDRRGVQEKRRAARVRDRARGRSDGGGPARAECERRSSGGEVGSRRNGSRRPGIVAAKSTGRRSGGGGPTLAYASA